MNSLDQFTFWLPGELKYAALKGGAQVGYEKSGYADRIRRAALGSNDGSMYTFLGTEWHAAGQAHANGFRHSTEHAKSAQLQYAKFAAGLFDKYVAARWLKANLPATREEYEISSTIGATAIISQKPWEYEYKNFSPAEELEKPFEDTLFASAILDLQTGFVDAAHTQTDERKKLLDDVATLALNLGGKATQCYIAYVDTHLTPEQYLLPQSVLAS